MDQPAAGGPGPRTPVVVGVGQASERLGQPGYRCRSPVALAAGEPIGERVYVRSFGFGNRVTTSAAQMDKLFPPGPAALSPAPSTRSPQWRNR
jgi:acetyl-CoA C-acetyltransferase